MIHTNETESISQPYKLSDGSWMVPCSIDTYKSKFIPLCRPQLLQKDNSVRVPWSDQQDKLLHNLVTQNGIKKWSQISKYLNTKIHQGQTFRQGKHCRQRWFNHLNPSLKRTNWTPQQDFYILSEQNKLGNKWSKIAKQLPGRTENSVKNRWKSIMRKAQKGSIQEKEMLEAMMNERNLMKMEDFDSRGGSGRGKKKIEVTIQAPSRESVQETRGCMLQECEEMSSQTNSPSSFLVLNNQ